MVGFQDLPRQFGRDLTSKECNRCNILLAELAGSVKVNLGVGKHSSNRMVIAQSVEGLMAIFLSERKGQGLKFAVNVKF